MRINAAVAAACRKTVKNKALKAQFPGCGGPAGAGKPPEIHHFAPECATILVTGHFSLFDHDFTQSFRIRHGAADEAANMPQTRVRAEFLVASAQHGRVANETILPSACQSFARFGTIGRSFSKKCEKVPMAGAKGLILANFIR